MGEKTTEKQGGAGWEEEQPLTGNEKFKGTAFEGGRVGNKTNTNKGKGII
jgi:hypothetical protein